MSPILARGSAWTSVSVFALTSQCFSFRLQFEFVAGGSVIKVFYVHVDDWVEPAQRKTVSEDSKVNQIFLANKYVLFQSTVRFRGSCFPRTDLSSCLQFLKTHARIASAKGDERPLVYTCGLGGSQFADEIRQTLDIKSVYFLALLFTRKEALVVLRTENLNELMCLLHGIRFCIRNMTIAELTTCLDLDYLKVCLLCE